MDKAFLFPRAGDEPVRGDLSALGRRIVEAAAMATVVTVAPEAPERVRTAARVEARDASTLK